MTTYEIHRPITILRDDLIIEQLPKKVRNQLGCTVETGFHLGEGKRDFSLRTALPHTSWAATLSLLFSTEPRAAYQRLSP